MRLIARKNFTLIELLVVIAIVAILAAILQSAIEVILRVILFLLTAGQAFMERTGITGPGNITGIMFSVTSI